MEMTMNKPLSLMFALGLALGAGAVQATDADRPIDERRPLKADARVEVSNVAGEITVETWDKNELHLTGSLSEQVEKLEITGDASRLKIEVKLPKRTRNVDDTILHLKVPAGIALEADGVSADIHVRGIKGDVEASSVSGDVELDVGSKRVEARSVSGDVNVQAPSAETRVESVSGDVTVRGVKGEVRGETVSGDIEVMAHTANRIELQSVSGSLELDGELAADADVEGKTMSGDIRLTLPRLPEASIELQTYSGEVEGGDALTQAGGGSREEKEYWRKGSGSGRVRLHSFSGDIDLRIRDVSEKRTVEKRVEKK
jgi:DUF4097 and DUF4098 domain-containing protein YvlB